MNPGRYEYMPMGGWTYMYGSGETVEDARKREDRARSRAAMPSRKNTRQHRR